MTRQPGRRRTLVAALLALSLAVLGAACGSDDGDTDTGGGDEPSSTTNPSGPPGAPYNPVNP